MKKKILFEKIDSSYDFRHATLEHKYSNFIENINDKNTFYYFFAEMLSNIKDHSKFNNAYILAKKQEDNIIDLSFLDDGITLPFTLQQHKEDNLTIYDATKGLSSKKEEGRGFGLPSTIKIISSMIQGELIIASRNAIYYKTYQNELSDNLNSSLVNGTLVSMRFDCTKLPNYIFNHLGGNMTTKTINMYERYGDIIGYVIWLKVYLTILEIILMK